MSLECLLNRLFWRRSKKTAKLRVNCLCERNPPVTGGFPSQGPVMRKMFPFDDVIIFLQRRIKIHLCRVAFSKNAPKLCSCKTFHRTFIGNSSRTSSIFRGVVRAAGIIRVLLIRRLTEYWKRTKGFISNWRGHLASVRIPWTKQHDCQRVFSLQCESLYEFPS